MVSSQLFVAEFIKRCQLYCAVTVACHVIPASGRLVDVDIPELSESPWPGFDIF